MYKNRRLKKSLRLQKIRNHDLSHAVLETSKKFCKSSSLHGFSMFYQHMKKFGKYRNPFQAVCLIIWAVSIVMGMIFGSFLMTRVWQHYQISPTITTIESNNYPIGNVSFPAVTICNINVVYKPNAVKIARLLKSTGISEKRIWSFFSNLSSLINYYDVDSDFISIYIALQTLNYTTEQLMYDLAHPCTVLIKRCYWLGQLADCDEIFRRTKSGFGFCCSFNYRALRTHLELNSEQLNQLNTPVIRISGAGEDASLRVVVDVQPNSYVSSKRFFYGAEVIVHDPEDFPEKSMLTAFVEPGKELSIAVVPSVVATQENVKALPIDLRFCRFASEKPLQTTKKYSFQSCITECRALTIHEICGCVPFFYPPLINSTTRECLPQCTLMDVECLSDNKYIFASLENLASFSSGAAYHFKSTSNRMACDCLPSCTEQNYGVETFISQLVNGVRDNSDFGDISNLSTVTVYFKDSSCIKYRREIFMTWDALLASFGGIFGLCLGGSVLSLFEIIFFATFKLYEQIIKTKHANVTIKCGHSNKIVSQNVYRPRRVFEKCPKAHQFIW